MRLLEGKVALVTGATRGIGRAIALKFAENGAFVAFTYISSDDAAKQLIAEIEALGAQAKGFKSDAANFDDATNVVESTIAELGHIDILVNNAGITRDGLLMRMNEEQWDSVINSNLKSAFNFCRAVVAHMARQRSGSIINMSSVVGLRGNAGQCNYAASKAGLVGLTKSIAKEFGTRGIRANCIAPGIITTDMTTNLNDELLASLENDTLLHRSGTPEEVANVALFLASELSSYITAQTINCCGGMKG